MNSEDIIATQNQLIGILFEIIKRMNQNSMLDEEYVALALSGGNESRMSDIKNERQQNTEAISTLLQQLET